MLAIVLILLFSVYMVFFLPAEKLVVEEEPAIRKAPQMRKLWSLAQTAMRERKPLKAEKALLTILRFDEKNAAAYNRLGILYAKERQFKEAIECFEIAQSLDNNASSLHNVGLIYLETENYEKAAMAFEQAIALEGDLPARHIAHAKALEKLGHRARALEELEMAYDLDPNTTTLRHILEVHERAEDEDGILDTKARILRLIEDKKAKAAAEKPVVRRKVLRRAARETAPKVSPKKRKRI
jgi:tetratricopeptide (TPR) repeat protein